MVADPIEILCTSKGMLYRIAYLPWTAGVLPWTAGVEELEEKLGYKFKELRKGLEEVKKNPELIYDNIIGLAEKIKAYGEERSKEEIQEENRKVVYLKKFSEADECPLIVTGMFPEESIIYSLRIEGLTKESNSLVKTFKKGASIESHDMIKKELYNIMKKVEELGKVKKAEIIPITNHPRFKRKNVKNT